MKKIFTLISIISVATNGLWAQTPNAGFETWTTGGSWPFTYDACTGWDSPNSQTATVGTFVCIKTTDKHSGTNAIKLQCKTIAGMQDAPGVATTGVLPLSNGNPITGGVLYTLRPDSIVGWYKYTPASGDNGFIGFRLYGSATDDNDSIADASFNTPATTVGTYTRFSKALTYFSANAVVNSRWLLCSTKDGNVPVINSTLFVDDLDLIFAVRDSIALTSGTNPMCAGQSATFTAYPHNGGTTPSYQWQVDGVNAGTGATFTTSSLTNGQVVTCILTSNLSGVTVSGSPATSPGITVSVGIPTPTITPNGLVLTSSSATGNQWYLDGVLISGATGQVYTATQIGNYTVIVTANGCTSTESAPINISTVGIGQSGNDYFFTVYPNPSNRNFNVSFNVVLKASYILEMKNTLGQIVYQEILSDYSGRYSKQMDVSQLGKGIYMISLTNPNNETIKKVVIY